MKEIISAMIAEYSTPVTPNNKGNNITSGTHNTKSLNKDNPIDNIGFPNDCKKILVAF